MSHEISRRNGRAEMFSGSGKVPWHGLGTVVEGLLTSAEALKAAGMAWNVVEHPVFSLNGSYRKCDGYKAICREDTGEVLSVMSDRYRIIQNAEAFEFFDAVTQSKEAVYDTAGVLHGGARIWIMAKLPGSLFINGDEHEKTVLLVNSHDGTYSLMMQQVLVRVVCHNTLSVALRGATNKIKIRHTANWKQKEGEARKALGIAEQYFASVQEALNGLGSHLLSKDEMTAFASALVPAKDETDVPTRTQNIRAEITRLFDRGAGNKGATRWDALQAVTDYADHSASLRGENSTRLESALLTTGIKQAAYDMLTDEQLMAGLLNRPMVPGAATVTADFARLLNQ